MAIEQFEALNPDGVKTLVREILLIMDKNFVQNKDIKDLLLEELVKYKLKVDKKDGCLYIEFPEDSNTEIVDKAIKEQNKRLLKEAIEDAQQAVEDAYNEEVRRKWQSLLDALLEAASKFKTEEEAPAE